MAFLDNQGVSKLCALLKDKFDSLWTAVNGKQGALTAGSNITISGNTISATDTTYTAGTNITISNGVISASGGGTTYTAGDNINIENGEISITSIELNTLGGYNEQEHSELQSTGLYVQSELTGTIDPETGDSEGYTFDSSQIDPFSVHFHHTDAENDYELSLDVEGITFMDNNNSNTGTLSMNSSGNLEWNGTELGSGSSLPSAPSNDGTYLLKCVVSSGTPTYSWESITVGGSY